MLIRNFIWNNHPVLSRCHENLEMREAAQLRSDFGTSKVGSDRSKRRDFAHSWSLSHFTHRCRALPSRIDGPRSSPEPPSLTAYSQTEGITLTSPRHIDDSRNTSRQCSVNRLEYIETVTEEYYLYVRPLGGVGTPSNYSSNDPCRTPGAKLSIPKSTPSLDFLY